MSESDVTENIVRPSFFVSLDNIKASNFADECLDKEMTIKIYYFPSNRDKNKIENLNMIDDLNEIFIADNLITLNEDFLIEIFDDIEIEVVDKVVHYYIPIFMSDEIEIVGNIDNTEYTEELNFKNNIC